MTNTKQKRKNEDSQPFRLSMMAKVGLGYLVFVLILVIYYDYINGRPMHIGLLFYPYMAWGHFIFVSCIIITLVICKLITRFNPSRKRIINSIIFLSLLIQLFFLYAVMWTDIRIKHIRTIQFENTIYHLADLESMWFQPHQLVYLDLLKCYDPLGLFCKRVRMLDADLGEPLRLVPYTYGASNFIVQIDGDDLYINYTTEYKPYNEANYSLYEYVIEVNLNNYEFDTTYYAKTQK